MAIFQFSPLCLGLLVAPSYVTHSIISLFSLRTTEVTKYLLLLQLITGLRGRNEPSVSQHVSVAWG